jgi:hypothetical protein
MIRFCRTSTALVLAALTAVPSTVSAAENPATHAPLTYNDQPLATTPFMDESTSVAERDSFAPSSAAGQWGYGRRGRHRNEPGMAAMLLGATGAIAGTAVLVYANRPECSANANLGGCGYGTKVVGASVLSAGLVALMIGALTWR